LLSLFDVNKTNEDAVSPESRLLVQPPSASRRKGEGQHNLLMTGALTVQRCTIMHEAIEIILMVSTPTNAYESLAIVDVVSASF
jgi:hypothetical protein